MQSNRESLVRFKFKSAKDYTNVTFLGDAISVAELKVRIFDIHKLKFGENFDLEIKDEVSGKVFTSESEYVDKNVSVEVRRVPGLVAGGILAQQAMARRNERYAEPAPAPAAQADPSAAPQGIRGANEAERIASLMEVSGKEYDRSGMPYQSMPPTRVPAHNLYQATVACRRCGDRGHTLRECPVPAPPGSSLAEEAPRVRFRKPTGIPSSSLAKVDSAGPSGHALRTDGGQIVVMKPNEDEFARLTAGLSRSRAKQQSQKTKKRDDDEDEDDDDDEDEDNDENKDTDNNANETAQIEQETSSSPVTKKPGELDLNEILGTVEPAPSANPSKQNKPNTREETPRAKKPFSGDADRKLGQNKAGAGRQPAISTGTEPKASQALSGHHGAAEPSSHGGAMPGMVPQLPGLPPLPPAALASLNRNMAMPGYGMDPRLYMQQQAYMQQMAAWWAMQQQKQSPQGSEQEKKEAVGNLSPPELAQGKDKEEEKKVEDVGAKPERKESENHENGRGEGPPRSPLSRSNGEDSRKAEDERTKTRQPSPRGGPASRDIPSSRPTEFRNEDARDYDSDKKLTSPRSPRSSGYGSRYRDSSPGSGYRRSRSRSPPARRNSPVRYNSSPPPDFRRRSPTRRQRSRSPPLKRPRDSGSFRRDSRDGDGYRRGRHYNSPPRYRGSGRSRSRSRSRSPGRFGRAASPGRQFQHERGGERRDERDHLSRTGNIHDRLGPRPGQRGERRRFYGGR